MKNTVKTAALLGLLSGLVLVIGGALGGRQGLVIAFGFAAVMNFGSYWFSDRVVLAAYRARPVDPGHPFYRLVERLTQRAGLPMPRVYVIPSEALNAFATGRNPEHAAVAATEGILRALNDTELEGVIGHELTHVKNRDILTSSVAATLAAAIMMLASIARWGLIFGGRLGEDDGGEGGNPIVLILGMILAPLAAALIQAAISRSREFAADQGGAQLVGSPDGLVAALRTIEAANRERPLPANPATAHLFIINPLSAQGLTALFSTHPPTRERIARLLHQGARETGGGDGRVG
jgi:heat shock protein HtpX